MQSGGPAQGKLDQPADTGGGQSQQVSPAVDRSKCYLGADVPNVLFYGK